MSRRDTGPDRPPTRICVSDSENVTALDLAAGKLVVLSTSWVPFSSLYGVDDPPIQVQRSVDKPAIRGSEENLCQFGIHVVWLPCRKDTERPIVGVDGGQQRFTPKHAKAIAARLKPTSGTISPWRHICRRRHSLGSVAASIRSARPQLCPDVI